MTATIREVLAGYVPAFALLYRPQWTGSHVVELLVCEHETVDRLADLPLSPLHPDASGPDLLALVPYRQIAERGLACHDDATPLVALRVLDRAELNLADAMRELPDDACELSGGGFDLDDDAYAEVTRRIVADEIGRGEGSNFVIRRTWCGTVVNHSVRTALACFRRLLQRETGTHCTFLVWYGGRALVGATPERLISLRDSTAVMNPVSGTYRYPPGGPDVAGLLRFLADRKEAEELYMVVDEELKMMSRICDRDVRVVGPEVTPMQRLAHTGYLITGQTRLDVCEVLRRALFAPTVTGSPLANACRVITRYERRGRGYYGGALAVIGQEHNRRTLDASILIRTANVDADGRFRIGVGSTLVRHSEPTAEVAETRAKAAALLTAFGVVDQVRATPSPLGGPARARAAIADPRVSAALADRNGRLARFWRNPSRARPRAELRRRRVLVVDADDDFTAMLATQVRALGPQVSVRGASECVAGPHDLVVLGPGPGDPRDRTDPRIAAIRALCSELLRDRRPFLSICLSHQILADLLGLRLARLTAPKQGTQHEIDFFGERVRVGFYNTFAAFSECDTFSSDLTGGVVQICRDPVTEEVFGLRAPRVRSIQFHAESVLTERGFQLLGALLAALADGINLPINQTDRDRRLSPQFADSRR